jgi:alkylation response protein AidB-like acyl-CoA dehydrogenase
MDFGLSSEQELLQQSARDFLRRECPTSLVRACMELTADGYPRELYARMAELGWLGLLIPTPLGGTGAEMLDAALLCQEFGRAALPGPFFASSVLAALTLRYAARESCKQEYLPSLARGETVGTLAWSEGSESLEPSALDTRCELQRLSLRIEGKKLFVLDAHVADWMVVVCAIRERRKSELALVLVPRDQAGVKVRQMFDADRTRRPCAVELRGVVLPRRHLVARGEKVRAALQRVFDAARVLIAADSLGGAEQVLELAVNYAKVRHQFGKPIGSFQAIQHACAEMVAAIEPARSLLWYAAYAFDHEPKESPCAASMAKMLLTDVYASASERSLRIHGGIGFTWEHDLHLWIKRSLWNRHAFGEPIRERERIAALCGW